MPFPVRLYVAAFAPGLPLGTADPGPVTGHCGVLSSIPGPGAPPVMTTTDVPRHVPVSLGGRITPVENHLQITPFRPGCLSYPPPGLWPSQEMFAHP